MGSRFARFRGFTKRVLGDRKPTFGPTIATRTLPEFIQLEDRSVPATFVVTNILDSKRDTVGGLSLRDAIIAANSGGKKIVGAGPSGLTAGDAGPSAGSGSPAFFLPNGHQAISTPRGEKS